jgi:hypothetical protein
MSKKDRSIHNFYCFSVFCSWFVQQQFSTLLGYVIGILGYFNSVIISEDGKMHKKSARKP